MAGLRFKPDVRLPQASTPDIRTTVTRIMGIRIPTTRIIGVLGLDCTSVECGGRDLASAGAGAN
jgi:hypothetical protein